MPGMIRMHSSLAALRDLATKGRYSERESAGPFENELPSSFYRRVYFPMAAIDNQNRSWLSCTLSQSMDKSRGTISMDIKHNTNAWPRRETSSHAKFSVVWRSFFSATLQPFVSNAKRRKLGILVENQV